VDATEYLFGDSVTAITDDSGGVHVTFERGERRTFDLVVGADGQHSRVRALAFGPEDSCLKHLGLYTVVFTTPNGLDLDRTGLVHVEPNRLVAVSSARDNTGAKVMMYVSAPPLAYVRARRRARRGQGRPPGRVPTVREHASVLCG
jgi:2-polyprenyl-6-methoxyphenol hydroxylase-like FAD-dependent oxidoreductase